MVRFHLKCLCFSESLNVDAEMHFRGRVLWMLLKAYLIAQIFLITDCFKSALVFPDAVVALIDQAFSDICV